MANKIYIDTGLMEQLSSQIAQLQRSLSSVGDDVSRSVSEVRRVASGQTGIIQKLGNVKRNVQRTAERAEKLARETGRAADRWEEAERRIAAQKLPEMKDISKENRGSAANGRELESLASAQDRTTKTFDDDKKNGTYGADQGDMDHNKKGWWFFGFRWFEDEDLYAYIRKHDRYKNYSQTEIARLMERINKEGCGYVAMVNNIYVEFEGREAEFERIFGFPMYDKNGKANYDYLIVDFYASTDDKYYLNENKGAVALVNDVIGQYEGREDEFRKKYGCDPLINGNQFNPEAMQKILDEYKDQSVVTMETSGTTTYSLENRIQHYMQEKGLTYSSETRYSGNRPSNEEINNYMNQGKNVNLAVGGFNLYDENGKIQREKVGNHWMTITGTTSDGRYIVSSWGKRYYIKPEELKDPKYYISDVSA